MFNQANTTSHSYQITKLLCGAALITVMSFASPSVHAQENPNLPELAPIQAFDTQVENDLSIDDVLKDVSTPASDASVEIVEPEAVIDVQALPTPESSELVDPQDANAKAAMEQAANIPNIPSISVSDTQDDNIFFDAEALVPQGEVARKSAPRKVSPINEPGSRFIVVNKNAGPNSKAAGLVSAERAMSLGRYASALEIYDKMYAQNKRDPNVLMGRAVAYQRLGQDDFAVQAYDELLEIRPKNLEARINMLGIVGQKYPAVALRQLLDLRDENSENVGVVAQIAVVQAKLEQYDEALRYLGIAASMEPKNPSHLFNMAVIADTAGDKKEAIRLYEEALNIDTLYGKGGAIPREAVFERLAGLR